MIADPILEQWRSEFEFDDEPDLSPVDDGRFRIKVYRARDLEQLVLPRPATPLVGPYLRKAMITLLGGVTGHGKTTLIAQAVKAASDGGEFLGASCDGGARVLVLDLEQHLETIQRVIREAGLEDSERVDYAPIPNGLALEKRSDQLDALEEIFALGGYDIVVIDPFYKLHEADSNDELQARLLIAMLRGWIGRHGFAILTATHCRKLPGGRNFITIDDLYGSSLFTRDPEVILGLQRHGDLAKLHVFKSREPGLNTGQTIELLFNRDHGYYEKPKTDPAERQKRLDEIADTALAWIEANPGQSTNQVTEAVKALAKCGADAVTDALDRQVKSGLLPEPSRGSRNAKLWYPLNHAGSTSPQTVLGEVTETPEQGQTDTTSPDLPDLYVVGRGSGREVAEAAEADTALEVRQ